MTGNDIPLREYFDHRIDTLEKNLTDKIDAGAKASEVANEVAKQAVIKAEIATERRLEGLNELREMVSEYQLTLMPRTEADQRFKVVEDKIEKLDTAAVAQAGRTTGLAAGWSYLIASVGLISVIAAILISIF